MEHIFHLQNEPYRLISDGEKSVELRLLDEKRQRIAVGDRICFLCEEGNAPLFARVTKLVTADNFTALFEIVPPPLCGISDCRRAIAMMDTYYTKEAQRRYRALAIYFVPEKTEGTL